MTTNDGDLRDTYYVLFVTPDPWVATYTSAIYSRMAAERHADYLIKIGCQSVKVVREV